MSSAQAAGAIASLAAIVLLVLLTGRFGSKFSALRMAAGLSTTDLVLRGSIGLDTKRRLHLVDLPEARVLVLSGGANDVLVVLPPNRAIAE